VPTHRRVSACCSCHCCCCCCCCCCCWGGSSSRGAGGHQRRRFRGPWSRGRRASGVGTCGQRRPRVGARAAGGSGWRGRGASARRLLPARSANGSNGAARRERGPASGLGIGGPRRGSARQGGRRGTTAPKAGGEAQGDADELQRADETNEAQDAQPGRGGAQRRNTRRGGGRAGGHQRKLEELLPTMSSSATSAQPTKRHARTFMIDARRHTHALVTATPARGRCRRARGEAGACGDDCDVEPVPGGAQERVLSAAHPLGA